MKGTLIEEHNLLGCMSSSIQGIILKLFILPLAPMAYNTCKYSHDWSAMKGTLPKSTVPSQLYISVHSIIVLKIYI